MNKLTFKGKKVACAPAIWRKFSDAQKTMWIKFYEAFLEPMNFAVGWEGKYDKERQEVTAHNMACQAVWAIEK